jgi:hypothetical protein
MVGHGDGGHAQLHGALDERLDVAGPVEEAVLGMDVEMDKAGIVHNPNGSVQSDFVKAISGLKATGGTGERGFTTEARRRGGEERARVGEFAGMWG